jgi:hypothetical protein
MQSLEKFKQQKGAFCILQTCCKLETIGKDFLMGRTECIMRPTLQWPGLVSNLTGGVQHRSKHGTPATRRCPAGPASRRHADAGGRACLQPFHPLVPIKSPHGRIFLLIHHFPPLRGKPPPHSPLASRSVRLPFSDSLRVDTPCDRVLLLP